jgi:hypothetical protein
MDDAQLPPPEVVMKAVAIFLEQAYDGPPPPHVQARVAELERPTPEPFYERAAFEREPRDAPQRYALRLGSRYYPHMKLVIERMPSHPQWFFRADTHDRHVQVDRSDPDWEPFQALMARNQEVAASIEAAWDRVDIGTFKRFLRRDLEARRSRSPDPPR